MTKQLSNYFSILILIIICLDCTKESEVIPENQKDTTLCVIDVESSKEHLVTFEELNIIDNLFQKNNLSLDNQQVVKIVIRDNQHHVFCQQYYGSIPIRDWITIYHFKDEILSSIFRPLIEESELENIDTIPSISKDTLAVAFIDTLKNDKWVFSTGLNIDSLIQDCLLAELIIHFSLTDSTFQEVFNLAYKYTLDANLPEPKAYYNAHDGSLIYYWNGVIIGK